ncbi:MAG: TolC family protein [Candidatus Sericytochromatia bacterium]|nr:TolC family protein [Candidatus Sericytochromatia bacterium]
MLTALLLGNLAAPPAPLSLNDALQRALACSPEMHQAELESRRARVVADGTHAERFSYSGQLAVGNYSGVFGLFGNSAPTPIVAPIGNATLLARWPLFTGFRLDHQISQAEASVTASQARAQHVRQQLVWQVTQAYWAARRAELRAATQQEAMTRAQTARDLVRSSFQLGRAHAAELDRAEVTLLTEESEALKASDEARRARDQLASLLQRDILGVPLQDPPAPTAGDPVSLQVSLAKARERRPDLRLAEADLAAKQAGVGVAAAEKLPQLEAISAYQHGNNPFIPTSQNRNVLPNLVGTWDARLNLSYNLFDHGVIQRNIQAQQLQASASEAALEAARRSAELEVKQAHAQLALARRRLQIGQRSVALATRNLAWLENRYRYGYALVTELNEARQSLKLASHQQIDARIDHALAIASLARATGEWAPDLPLQAGLMATSTLEVP